MKEISFYEAETNYPSFGTGMTLINEIIRLGFAFIKKNPNGKDCNIFQSKKATPLIVKPSATVGRNRSNDNVIPMETVTIQSFRREKSAEVENPIIHIGPAADEFARSRNSLAITIANHIYFRNNAYKPETEEGRALLAHELTHVQQYTERRIDTSVTTEELEAEADTAEASEIYDPDPMVTFEMGGEVFTMLESDMYRVSEEVSKNIVQWVEDQKISMEEKQYLKFLCGFERWLKE